MSLVLCEECKLQVPSYGRGGRSPKQLGDDVVRTDIEGPFKADLMGLKCFHAFVDEAGREKQVIGLKSRVVVVEATVHCIDNMTRERQAVKCTSDDRAGKLGRSVKFFEDAG